MAKDPRYDHIFLGIQRGSNEAQTDQRRRKAALSRLEKVDSETRRRVALYYSRRDQMLLHGDILPFTSMLKSIGTVRNLDLIVVSPGGDGTAAETMLDICRKYCTDTLRVVVPLYAKSAATLLALGADRIIMGETSELGPIDAQVPIIEGNVEQQVSADHFIRARDAAIGDLSSESPEKREAAQIQLALLNPAFLQHCTDLINFSKDFAGKQLQAHMFRDEYAAHKATWKKRIEKVVENLTASSKHLLHGRMITAQDIAGDPDLQHLKIECLNSTDPYWVALSELLVRTDIVAGLNKIGKMLFARNYEMFG